MATDRAAVFADSDLVVPMEDMGGAYVKLANNKRVGKAVKAGARYAHQITTAFNTVHHPDICRHGSLHARYVLENVALLLILDESIIHRNNIINICCRFLDVTALTASRFLRQYPLGRLAVFSYIVLIHLFLWFTINHMQRRALTGETLAIGRLKDT